MPNQGHPLFTKEAAMKNAILLALSLIILPSFPAYAQQTGHGVFCDTAEQWRCSPKPS